MRWVALCILSYLAYTNEPIQLRSVRVHCRSACPVANLLMKLTPSYMMRSLQGLVC